MCLHTVFAMVKIIQNQRRFNTFDSNAIWWGVIVCGNVCVHMATCEGRLGSAAVSERERAQSGPQAELLIGLVKVQGYRWVTKPPLITYHFCDESRLKQKAQKVYQTKKSDSKYTFLIQICFWHGRPAHFPSSTELLGFVSPVWLKLLVLLWLFDAFFISNYKCGQINGDALFIHIQ